MKLNGILFETTNQSINQSINHKYQKGIKACQDIQI